MMQEVFETHFLLDLSGCNLIRSPVPKTKNYYNVVLSDQFVVGSSE